MIDAEWAHSELLYTKSTLTLGKYKQITSEQIWFGKVDILALITRNTLHRSALISVTVLKMATVITVASRWTKFSCCQ